MKKIILFAVSIIVLTSCKSQAKYDFSNVQSTSMDAMHNPSVRVYTGGPVIKPIDNDTLKK